MAFIHTIGKTEQDMYDSLTAISERDVRGRMFTIEHVAYAGFLWKCSEHQAEQRLANGELPDKPKGSDQ